MAGLDKLETAVFKSGNKFLTKALAALKSGVRAAERIGKAVKEAVTGKSSYSDFTKSIKKAFKSTASDARRIARTETTRAENEGRFDAGKEYERKTGKRATKTWICMFRNSRESHMDMHMQTVYLEEPFYTPSGGAMMYPGDDTNVGPEEIINCQCTMYIEKE